MANSARFQLRLEDFVALLFFLFNLAIVLVFRPLRAKNVSPADVMVIIPSVAVLLFKELIHHFVSRQQAGTTDALRFIQPYWKILRDWFPFLVVLMMYYSLWGDATHLLVTHDRDDMLIRWDQRLFGFQASVALQGIISPPLTAWMSFAYFFHVLNIPIVACFLYLRRPLFRFREMMCGLLIVFFFGLLGYLSVPAIGPVYTLSNEYHVNLYNESSVFAAQTRFMDFARIRRDCFPSLHVGVSLLVWMYAFRNSRRLFWLLAPMVLSLWFSTVYLRYHYLVDVVAGLVLPLPCFYLANYLFAHYADLQVPVVIPEAARSLLTRWQRLLHCP